MSTTLPTIFSGIQPTGNLHLGNYLGSIANWTSLQDNNKCLFGIMDLHSITTPQNPQDLRNNILETAIVYLAAGIDPKKSVIFTQSVVAEHSELAWILGTLTPLGWLNRMTQFKEKSVDNENLGLYAYPVLMAADILLYKANIIPVGEDQKQHLELARDIAGAFNRQFKTGFFKLPEPMILGNCTRVMSLQDGTKKMSKSDESDLSRINLSDSADEIVKKIKKAKTDSVMGITYDKARPEIYNLLNIFSAATRKKPEEIALDYTNSGAGKFKEDLAQAVATMLEPIQNNIKSLRSDLDFVKKVLNDGKDQAREIAANNIKEIKQIVGLY
jgi:tryptophanyl-tRNA synthetase